MPPKTMINGGKRKLAWVKALAPYVVALLSLAGIALGVWAQIRTGNTNDALRVTVSQLNTRTIPMLEGLLKEQRVEISKLRETSAILRERVAYLEALTKSLADKIRVKLPIGPGAAHIMGPPELKELDKPKPEGKPDLIPRLKVQQLVQPE